MATPTDSQDVFRLDRVTGRTTLISTTPDGESGNRPSQDPLVSANGRWVAFMSRASNLVRGDTNGEWDVFVRDARKESTRRVSVSSTGRQANDGSSLSSISANGRFVGFTSAATNLVRDDDNGIFDPFYRDRQEQTTHRVIEPADYRGGSEPFLSSNGRYIAWYAEDPSDGSGPVAVRDRRAHETTTLSDGQPLDMTPDGSRVMYRESGRSETFGLHVFNTRSGQLTRVPAGRDALGELSADARLLAVGTDRPLVTGDSDTDYDAYLRDRMAREWTALSPLEVQTGGVELSGRGNVAAFTTDAALAANDTNGVTDVYLTRTDTGGPCP